MPITTPRFALSRVIPSTALAAWGGRFTATTDGDVQLPGDRHGSDEGPHSQTLTDLIDQRIPIGEQRAVISDLLTGSQMRTDRAEDVILYLDENLIVHASTRASHGYCYVTAWLTSIPATPGTDPLAPAPTDGEPDLPAVRHIALSDGEIRTWEPDRSVGDLGRMYVLDVFGVCLLIRERKDGVYIHVDRESDTATDPERDVIIEFDNGGETTYPAAA